MTTPNVLTNLIPELYNAKNIAKKDKIGFLNSVSMDSTDERVAKDQTIRSFVTPEATSAAIVPGQLPPDTGDQTFTSRTLTITDCEQSSIVWNGEQVQSLIEGPTQDALFRAQIAESMTVLLNKVELKVGTQYVKASRCASPVGTALFDSNAAIGEYAEQYEMMLNNGGPLGDLHSILSISSATLLRKNGLLQRLNEAGTDTMLREGILGQLSRYKINDSAQVIDHTKGTGASATTDAAGYAIGDTVITLASAGTGTILAGDRIKITGDDNEYVVTSGDADVSNGGTITIGTPGLRETITGATAITVGASYKANMNFARSAIHVVTRPPKQHPLSKPLFSRLIKDAETGLTFDVRAYDQYHQVKFEVSLCWGVEVMNPAYLHLMADTAFA